MLEARENLESKGLFCKQCIAHCAGSTGNNLSLLAMDAKEIGSLIGCRQESALFYAPAGNFPENPVVTVCGLATSVQAKIFMQCQLAEGKKPAVACLRSVYRGQMAVNLALLLNALGLGAMLSGPIKMNIDDESVLLTALTVRHLGRSGLFTGVPESLHLTQATCCWSRDGDSRFRKEWIEYSRDCREKGYLQAVLRRFIASSTSRLLVFLGKENLHNIETLKTLLAGKEHKIKIHHPGLSGWIGRKLAKQLSYPDSDFDKLICFVHHPANTGHLYNNRGKEGPESLLYKFYTANNGWVFVIKKYGRTSEIAMSEARKFYQDLQTDIKKISSTRSTG